LLPEVIHTENNSTAQFIVDGSIHPDLPTGNIQATIMVVAEAAAARILAQK
jgi:cellobiose dehydrogenase (acceptor)